jgi:hypothetical protein
LSLHRAMHGSFASFDEKCGKGNWGNCACGDVGCNPAPLALLARPLRARNRLGILTVTGSSKPVP